MGDERLAEVGRQLRRLRVAAGLSGAGLARRAGVPQPTVSRVETGWRVADAEVVVRLLRALGLEAGEFERLAGLVREPPDPRASAKGFRLVRNPFGCSAPAKMAPSRSDYAPLALSAVGYRACARSSVKSPMRISGFSRDTRS
ncbi:helix-turn-helix domain-containing protein [Thermomonospora cellulosilytica]|uniref:helix-turn-helix domain-containing protein n=1 Tax=Thermomonospora cellulosilytica TaxID=1411118 RepID=UPI00160414B3|nr:helix-turn-helix transcriptional regulator [Thermomonospora cellulosilytica]